MQIEQISTDVAIIGAGGAGLRAAIEARRGGAAVLVLSKVPPLRSHTVAAQGGINASLGNVSEDHWRWHAYDTVRGGDWLADQDVVATMCEEAAAAIVELEHMGMAFSRLDNGKIYQRAYGGQKSDYGKGGQAYRACSVADRTGHSLMATLYGEATRLDVDFMPDCMALDLLKAEDGSVCGLLVWQFEQGVLYHIQTKEVIIASGGYGQAWQSTTSSSICTGDGNAMALRAGMVLQDMEFVQFHPTSIYGSGILITEGARGEGAYLLNGQGERFMERYAPNSMELASRDVISRAIQTEIMEGRGAGVDKDHVLISLTHLDHDHIEAVLPNVLDVAKTFARVDALSQPIAVIPAVHYTMGGIASDKDSQVYTRIDGGFMPVAGISVIGEAACNSVHGANRLGCNSLLDLVVFGKRAGARAALTANDCSHKRGAQHSIDLAKSHLAAMQQGGGLMKAKDIKQRMQAILHQEAAVFRQSDALAQGLCALEELHQTFKAELAPAGTSLCWNSDLMDTIETENLLLQALAVMHSANARKESRGAHYVQEYPNRDDTNWLKHSAIWLDDSGEFRYGGRDVVMESADYAFSFATEERRY